MNKKVLVLGCTGMIGHVIFLRLAEKEGIDVFGTAREPQGLRDWFGPDLARKVRDDVDSNNFDSVIRAMASIQPDVVINCLGLIKQLPMASDPLSAITTNSLLPHRISMVCKTAGARMIHMGTDCVFRGDKGNYTESDPSDADDLYGRSKFLGEVTYPHCFTMRTSTVGHELKGKHGLVEWFLSQEGKTRGFKKVFFSGMTTIEIARIITDYVLPNERLAGMYHVSSSAISKNDFLQLVAKKYGKVIEIEPYEGMTQDRSLDSSKFRRETGYVPPSWEEMIDAMHANYTAMSCYKRR